MELIGKSASNDSSNIGMLPIASNDVSINYSEQRLQIFTNNDKLNGLKVSTKMQKRE